ncbi:MAG: single-stranded DNA-binding protein [Ruminococcus sp.]|nr:single-stranded DNA-binding protein [Ruminococcus sp.]
MLNKVMMTGRLTSEPVLTTEDDMKYCKFGIAVELPKQKVIDTAETDNFNCIAVEDNARAVSFLYSKGGTIAFVGSLRKDADDSTVIVVEELHFSNRFAVKVDVDSEQLF